MCLLMYFMMNTCDQQILHVLLIFDSSNVVKDRQSSVPWETRIEQLVSSFIAHSNAKLSLSF